MAEPPPEMTEDQRRAVIASRNRALALVLLGFVILFFAITIVKIRL